MINQKNKIIRFTINVNKLKKKSLNNFFFRDMIRLFAIFTIKFDIIINIVNYVIKHVINFATIDKIRNNIIINVNVRIEIFLCNYKVNAQFIDRIIKFGF